MKDELRAKFRPLEDITAYELALIVSNLRLPAMECVFTKKQWRELPADISRHFAPSHAVAKEKR